MQGLTVLVGALSLAIVLGLRRTAPAVPGSLVAVGAGILLVAIFGLDDHGVAIVGTIDSGLPSLGVPDVSLHDYGSLVAGGVGVMLVGFAEGLGAAKTYARARALRDRHEPRAARARRREPRLGPLERHGGQRLALEDRGQRLGRRATQLSGLVVAVLTVVTLLLLTGLFEQLPLATLAAVVIAAVIELVDFPALARLYRIYAGRARAGSPSHSARTSSPRSPRCSACSCSTRCPGCSSASACRCSCCSTAPRGRTSPRSAGSAGAGRGWTSPPPGLPRAGRDRGAADRGRPLLRQRRHRARARLEAAEGNRAVVLDAETVPSLDVTAAEMLAALAGDLRARGVTLVIAGDVGVSATSCAAPATGSTCTATSTRRSPRSRADRPRARPVSRAAALRASRRGG